MNSCHAQFCIMSTIVSSVLQLVHWFILLIFLLLFILYVIVATSHTILEYIPQHTHQFGGNRFSSVHSTHIHNATSLCPSYHCFYNKWSFEPGKWKIKSKRAGYILHPSTIWLVLFVCFEVMMAPFGMHIQFTNYVTETNEKQTYQSQWFLFVLQCYNDKASTLVALHCRILSTNFE